MTARALTLWFGFGDWETASCSTRSAQWRNVIADVETNQTLDGLQRNLFWDGVFHAATATVTAMGLLVLSYALARIVARRDRCGSLSG